MAKFSLNSVIKPPNYLWKIVADQTDEISCDQSLNAWHVNIIQIAHW